MSTADIAPVAHGRRSSFTRPSFIGLGAVARAELAKLTRRPSTWVLLATTVALNQVFAYVIPYFAYRGDTTSDFADGATADQLLAGMLPEQLATNTVGAFAVFVGALALVLGALVTGSEYTSATLKTLLTQRPGRITVALGQMLTVVLAAGVAVLVLAVTGALTAVGIALVEGEPIGWPALGDLASGLGAGWAILAMWGTVGAALGAVLRSVALPIGLGVVWILAIENLVAAVSGSTLTALAGFRDLLPGTNAGSLLGAVLPSTGGEPAPGVQTLVSGGRGLVTVLVYLVICVVVAVVVTRRRDVS
ncbi:ABC transporter permease [Gordonia sinesedis]